ncbi:hypothetical protein PFISCL1PPCAC_15869, partial [Pristionchus fissidentatus]
SFIPSLHLSAPITCGLLSQLTRTTNCSTTNMSTTTTEQSLDSLLAELVQNADEWAAIKSDLIDSPTSPSSADGQHPCFDQLSRAISSHVTDLLMRRLRLNGREAEENEETDDEDRPWIDERGRERRGRSFLPQNMGSDSLRSSRGSLSSRDSPNSSTASGRVGGAHVTPVVRGSATARVPPSSARAPSANSGSTAVSRAGSSCSLATIGSRYHSENRLDKNYPAARVNETPLENRASRLRRMSIERQQADRVARSAAASPMPQRRSISRRSSGCGGQ